MFVPFGIIRFILQAIYLTKKNFGVDALAMICNGRLLMKGVCENVEIL